MTMVAAVEEANACEYIAFSIVKTPTERARCRENFANVLGFDFDSVKIARHVIPIKIDSHAKKH
jgi:hypothetical protein